ncbi:MAG: hypothetical protein IT371_08730 [Deltaproteobacteria bacterium]|nr:hypothetical protein [Deltaproteobacteria bacterium]
MVRAWTRGVAAAALLGVGACTTPVSEAPVPEGRDWYFVAAGFRRHVVRSTTSSSTSHSGGRAFTTTTTLTQASSGYTGVRVPQRAGEPVPPYPGSDELLRSRKELLLAPFRPLGEAPL